MTHPVLPATRVTGIEFKVNICAAVNTVFDSKVGKFMESFTPQ
jgi:hypothetical protein